MNPYTMTERERLTEGGAVVGRRTRIFGALAMVGGAALMLGAVLVDLGSFTDRLFLMSVGDALSAGAGLALIFLPIGLLASRVGGRGILAVAGAVCLAAGICLASLVDVPALLDPTDVAAGAALGPVGLVLISAGFLAWFAAIRRAGILDGWRRYVFLIAGLWFLVTFPTVQLPLFVVPTGKPSYVLLAGALGMLQLLIGMVVRDPAFQPHANAKADDSGVNYGETPTMDDERGAKE